jgi:hypothetical protein
LTKHVYIWQLQRISCMNSWSLITMVKIQQYNIEVRRPFVHGLFWTNRPFIYHMYWNGRHLKTVVDIYQTIRCHFPEAHSLHCAHFENLRTNTVTVYFHLLFFFTPLLTDGKISFRNMRFNVLTLVNIKTMIIWNVIPCGLVYSYRHIFSFNLEDGGRRFIWNIGNHPLYYMSYHTEQIGSSRWWPVLYLSWNISCPGRNFCGLVLYI